MVQSAEIQTYKRKENASVSAVRLEFLEKQRSRFAIMESLLRQVLERAGTEEGEQWLQWCLSLPPSTSSSGLPPVLSSLSGSVPSTSTAPVSSPGSLRDGVCLQSAFPASGCDDASAYQHPLAVPVTHPASFGGERDVGCYSPVSDDVACAVRAEVTSKRQRKRPGRFNSPPPPRIEPRGGKKTKKTDKRPGARPLITGVNPMLSTVSADAVSRAGHGVTGFSGSVSVNPVVAEISLQDMSAAQVVPMTTENTQSGSAAALPVVSVPVASIPASQPGVSGGSALVAWIVGHSFIYWAHKRADYRCYGTNLTLSPTTVKLYWYGQKGLSWFNLRKILSSLYLRWPVPDIIVLHLAGNDLGRHRTLDIIAHIKGDFLSIHSVLPNCVLVYSEIIPRLLWFSTQFNKFEKVRKNVNRAVSKFMPSINGLSFRHVDLEGGVQGFYRPDGIHLSDVALDIFNLNLQSCVEMAVGRLGCRSYGP
ncbi:uncharacterized protein LOC120940724 [Rana temporaria]|uniref:uncharacterized protein LOC120940724 n=1 Tax=Rana temporaria TaxID=8407 RepID=UPI001AAD8E4C|nr:uncharacterized protein LOC120940724 [Rana temporaria]